MKTFCHIWIISIKWAIPPLPLEYVVAKYCRSGYNQPSTDSWNIERTQNFKIRLKDKLIYLLQRSHVLQWFIWNSFRFHYKSVILWLMSKASSDRPCASAANRWASLRWGFWEMIEDPGMKITERSQLSQSDVSHNVLMCSAFRAQMWRPSGLNHTFDAPGGRYHRMSHRSHFITMLLILSLLNHVTRDGLYVMWKMWNAVVLFAKCPVGVGMKQHLHDW